ncbi:hypothetical protein NS365_18615 [Aureimonas ureilytica]|uniref:CobQ/CobB/MinD/ParA nucleotide binding domain-containing protein n=1 Tax=Aureimonas ureilytica TaxID=401562 RepID=A0A175RK73_9HYPH|nr:ParA family protein [Aureimonas ureilytica]KTR03354.1 hypothetical protein NS365_18615 [Aureimonas ureilytica]
MAYIISVVAQKGGCGKSTVARLVAAEFSRMPGNWDVKIADMDVSQATSFAWMQRRHKNKHTPEIRVEAYQRVEKALADAASLDVMVLDGAPHATAQTLEMSRASDIVVIPTCTAKDDLDPAVNLARELKAKGVPVEKIVFVLSRTGDSDAEVAEARDYLERTNFRVATGSLPERTAFRRASDLGMAMTETAFPSLNERATSCFASIVETLQQPQAETKKTKGKKAA